MSEGETKAPVIEVLAERIARERDVNYKERIKTVVEAQKALTDAAFAASEKAILKAEESQREYPRPG